MKTITLSQKRNRTTFSERMEQLSFLFFCLCILDCSVSGAGRYITFGFFSPRIILGALALLLVLPKLFSDFKRILHDPVFIAFLVFICYLAVCAIRGYLAGNLMTVWRSDIKGFLWLALVPVAVLTVHSESRLNIVLHCIVAGALGQVLLVFAAESICTFLPHGINYWHRPFIDMGIGSLTTVSKDITRVFLSSCPYMVFACSIVLFRQLRKKRVDWLGVAVVTLCLMACLLSFTRSLYGCIFVVGGLSVLALFCFYPQHRRRSTIFLLAVILSFGIGTFALEKAFDAGYTKFALQRTLGLSVSEGQSSLLPVREIPETEKSSIRASAEIVPALPDTDPLWTSFQNDSAASDALRQTTQAELRQLIRRNPIWGNGLGAHAPTREGPDEYFYLDMMARTGIVGLILYLLPFILVLLICIRKRKTLVSVPLGFAVIFGMIGFWAITYFNPWMNASLGIATYALYCSMPGVLVSVENTSKNK